MTTNEQMIELASQEERDWNLYKKIYKIKNPEPKLASYLNWKLVLVLIGAVGVVTFSAFRNSGAFFTMATRAGVPDWAVVGEAVSGIAAVNILLIGLSILLSYKKRNISDFSLYAGTSIALSIGALIGLSQAMAGIDGSDPGIVKFINSLLVIFVGIGIPCLEWLGGDMIGVEFVRFEEFMIQSKQTYKLELQTWEANARRGFGAWLANKEHKLSKHNEQQTQTPVRTVIKQTRQQTNNRTSNSEQTVVRLLDTVYTNEQRVLGVTELTKLIANEQGLQTNSQEESLFVQQKKGYVSQVRNRWITQKGITP